MRRILTLAALAATVLFSGMNLAVSAADNLPVTVDINGEAVTFDSQPQIMNDRVMVPMRAIFEKLGCYVFWDNDSKTAKGVRNGHVVSIVVGDKNAYVDSQRKELDQAAVITAEERILVPLRFVSEALGADVEWNGDQRNVSIADSVKNQYFYIASNSFLDIGSWNIDGNNIKGRMDEDVSKTQPAIAKVNVVRPGSYRLWVRAKDFATNQQGTRYFNAAVDDMKSEKTFGKHGQEGFIWEDGGTFELTEGEHTLSLIDSSAFFARCEGVILTDDMDFVPPDDLKELETVCKAVDPYIALPPVSYPEWTKADFAEDSTAVIENDSYKLVFYHGNTDKGSLIQNEVYTKNNGEWVKIKSRNEELAVLMMKAESTEYNTTENQTQWVDQTFDFQGQQLKRLTNGFFKAGTQSWFVPTKMEQISDDAVRLYAENGDGTLTITYLLDHTFEEPKVTLNAKFAKDGAYSFLMYSGDGVKYEDYDTVTSPYLYVKHLLPADDSIISEPFLRTPMYTLNYKADNNVKTPGRELTSGVVVDPSCVSQRIAYPDTAEFGMVYRTPTGLVRPQICAPIFGTDSSRFQAGDTYEFSYRIINQFDTWYNTYKHVVRDLYNVKDLRTNYFTSLNEAIYNATDLWLDDYYGGWDPKAMSYYNMEARDVTTQSNMLEAIQKYLITGEDEILDERAVPTLAYLLSRPKTSFKYNETMGGSMSLYVNEGLPSKIGSPTNYEAYVFGGLYEMTQGRMPFLLDYALNKANDTTLMSQKYLYKYTGNEIYKKNVIAKADDLLKNNINTGEKREAELWGFVIYDYTQMLSTFIPAYEMTGEQKYLDGAEEAGRLLCTALSAVGYQNGYAEKDYYTDADVIGDRPVVHLDIDFFWRGDKKLRPGFKLDDNGITFSTFDKSLLYKGTVPGWAPATVGLGVEHPLSAKFGSHITANAWAGNFMKLAGYTGDEMFATMARNAMIGRFGNYNGYSIERYQVNGMLPDYPYKGPDFNTIYYHHIPVFMAIVDDYLINSVWYASEGNIKFPSLYQGGYAYFDTNQYGAQPGKFYDEEDMWLWNTRGILETDSVNVDYICARKDGKLGIALLNEGNDEMTTTVKLGEKIQDGNKVNTKAVLYDAEGKKSEIEITNGSFTVTIPSKGIQSLVVDIPQITVPAYYNKFTYSNEIGQTVSEHKRGKGYVIQLSKDVYHAFVYVTDTYKEMSSLTINYKIGDESYSQTVQSYPYEFLIKVEDPSKEFVYNLTAIDVNGKQEDLGGGTLRPIDTDQTSKQGITQKRVPIDRQVQSTSNLLPASSLPKTEEFDKTDLKIDSVGQDSNANFRLVTNKNGLPAGVDCDNIKNATVEMKWSKNDGSGEYTAFSYVMDCEDRGGNVILVIPSTRDVRAEAWFTTTDTLKQLTLHYKLPDYAEETVTK